MSNESSIDCLGGVLFAYTQLQISIELIVIRFVCICLVLRKMFINYETFVSNRIWLGFFSLMNIGNIIYVIVYCIALYATARSALEELDEETTKTITIAFHIGTLFVNTFFGLFPNFFYYFYKTHIIQDDWEKHKKLFIANGIVISIFFVVIFIMAIVLNGQSSDYPTDVIIAIEMGYIIGVHMLCLKVINTVVSRVQKSLQWFTVYVTVYSILVILRSIFLIILDFGFSYFPYTAMMILERLTNACLILVLVLMMKDIKFGSSSHAAQSSTVKETTTEL